MGSCVQQESEREEQKLTTRDQDGGAHLSDHGGSPETRRRQELIIADTGTSA
jgi:hypothetical protein